MIDQFISELKHYTTESGTMWHLEDKDCLRCFSKRVPLCPITFLYKAKTGTTMFLDEVESAGEKLGLSYLERRDIVDAADSTSLQIPSIRKALLEACGL